MTTYHVIGDVHGHAKLLRELLTALGWRRPRPHDEPHRWVPPEGVRAVFVGDLVDRGPDNLGVLAIARSMARDGHAHLVLGNHDFRTIQMLRGQLGLGRPPSLALGRLMTWVELLGVDEEEKRGLLRFLESLPLFLDLDEGRLLVVHARWSGRFRRLDGEALLRACAFGRVEAPESEAAEPGSDAVASAPSLELELSAPLPPRARWTRRWKGRSLVLWGHQVVRPGAVVRIGDTVNVESGCFLGHALSAYVYPEGRVLQVGGEGVSWKTRVAPYRPVQGWVFPSSLADVERLRREDRLELADDYVARLEMELEARGCPPLTPEMEQVHRRLFERVVDEASRRGEPDGSRS